MLVSEDSEVSPFRDESFASVVEGLTSSRSSVGSVSSEPEVFSESLLLLSSEELELFDGSESFTSLEWFSESGSGVVSVVSGSAWTEVVKRGVKRVESAKTSPIKGIRIKRLILDTLIPL